MDEEKILAKFKNRQPSVLGMERLSRFAVLLPLIKMGDGLHVLFEVRAEHLKKQPGEICFPGGRIERTDKDAQAAAIRETAEELRIDGSMIRDVVPLDYVVSSYGNRVVFPYAGFLPHTEFHPNSDEVKKLFTVPLSYLAETEPECYRLQFKVEPDQDFPFHLIRGGKAYKWNTHKMDEYFYYYKDYVIWGLTASILKNFLDTVKR
ncbi:coenzyme A pyrophosphatase [Weizmannia acidilactici]|uniref:Coenzyme A pyrophosphatase n=1 Tax=Weizmannia acidilactici TaxID=2607726 RepID=A0A5J4JEA1_9BACI|nr:CoA pyrophosphatase [Weizmannia acidilactici]GER66616.1 coenzyme A pyrophosphatase [Weizmannia acidilactici]GER68887.1 coenzyme A pyrophosphatase [Weizmannia acidilactici]GER73516.1 coenzyme A pyrophosphatase [Weizmannia acidilactici]